MNRVPAVRRHRLSVAALFAAGVLFASTGARADFPFPPSPRELHHEVRGLVHDVLRTLDRIPVEIHAELVGDLSPFLAGNVYFAPHRHYHETYSFPVWIDGAVYYRPYVYCNHRLYGDYGARPQFWSGWGQASQGHWCEHHRAYYPTGHACFHAQYRRPYGSGYRPDYDSSYRPDYRPQYRPQYDNHYGPQYRPGHRPNYRPQYPSNHGSGYDSHGRPHSGTHGGSGYGSHRGGGYGSHDRRGGEHRHDSSCHHDRGDSRH